MIEKYGEPNLYTQANEELLDDVTDLLSIMNDPYFDKDVKNELIIKVRRMDNLRRRKLYSMLVNGESIPMSQREETF